MRQAVLAVRENPFAAGGTASNYAAPTVDGAGKIIHALDGRQQLPISAEDAHRAFRQHVLQTEFSCIGAKAAINGNNYRFGFYGEMNRCDVTTTLAHDLWHFVREQPAFQTDYASFIACFASPIPADEREWENLLWTQLQNLHELDAPLYDWDETVSDDPENAEFSFSFASRAFFVVGLHPQSSRLARQFAYPTLVFNAHQQFERLRAAAKFERMQQTIRQRELNLQGSLNPNLSNYGEASEARQYSGRAVEKNWRCPFARIFGKK